MCCKFLFVANNELAREMHFLDLFRQVYFETHFHFSILIFPINMSSFYYSATIALTVLVALYTPTAVTTRI
jgi:hypothetical protein